MPKIVDKNQRRKEIALSCVELIYEVGIKKLTVEQVAKKAGIGKGTIYEYFENKDDIVFEIINIHIAEYHEEFLKVIKDLKSTRKKILCFFKFVMDNSEENLKHFNGYKEYLSIVLSDEHNDMKRYNNSCHIFFNEQLKIVIDEGVKNNELIPQSRNFIDSLLIFEKGVALMKMTHENFDAVKICEDFLNNFFDLVEVKSDK